MKKTIALLFALLLCIGSVACAAKPAETAAVSGVEDGILTVTMPKTEPKQKVTKAIEVS